MIQSVDPGSDRFEGLRNYILGNKRSPPDVPEARVRPRLANKPGDDIPDAPSVIPTSSQRPGKRTNDTVPYAWLVFAEFHGSPADPTDILPGDLVLVHRTSRSLGHNSNRASKVASWRQLNDYFAKKSSGTVLTAGSKAAIIEARKAALNGLNEAIAHTSWPLVERPSTMVGRQDIADRLARMMAARHSLKKTLDAIKVPNAPVEFIPEIDWQAAVFVADWTPDGVLMSRDDDEQNSSFFMAGHGESGTALNIAVQGPAATMNSSTDASSIQVFDQAPMLMDDIYVLLLAIPELDGGGSIVSFSFQYKPTSERIISEIANPTRPWSSSPDAEYPSEGGLSFSAVSRTVYAWRIGRIMDSNAVKSPRMRIKVNVCITPLPRILLVEHFGLAVGSAFDPKPPPPKPPEIADVDATPVEPLFAMASQ